MSADGPSHSAIFGLPLIGVAVLGLWWLFLPDEASPNAGAESRDPADPDPDLEDVDPRELAVATTDAKSIADDPNHPDDPDPNAMIREVPPDMPVEPVAVRPEFEAALSHAAETNTTGPVEEACVAWSRALIVASDEDADPREREITLYNVADSCGRAKDTPRSVHELRLAHEALARFVESTPTNEQVTVELTRFRAMHPDLGEQRSAMLIVDQHPEGTSVSLDGQAVGTEPCVVAVLVDGHPHRLDFAGPEGAATIYWEAEAPDAAPPLLPALAPAN